MASPPIRFGHDPLSGKQSGTPALTVRAVSEQVFCPRAAVLTLESEKSEEEPQLGPKLDFFVDYDEHRFVAAVETLWGKLRLCVTLLAPAVLLIYVVWRLSSPIWTAVATLPACLALAMLWDTLRQLITTVRERRGFERAPVVDLKEPPTQVREVNWWSLRKAGFDCLKPEGIYEDPVARLRGQPWRILTKDTVTRIPVIRKHRGKAAWGPQHRVRLAGYAHLIEEFERASAPFGVLMFAGSYDCVLIPLDSAAHAELRQAIEETRESIQIDTSGRAMLPFPPESRCRGCAHGKPTLESAQPRRDGRVPPPEFRTRAAGSTNDKVGYRSPCGDRFRWVPPHEEAKRLGLTS